MSDDLVDFLADPTPSVIDFLADGVPDDTTGVFCDPLNGGCGHFLTVHSRGMIVHDRCLHPGCDCKRAVVTRNKRG